MNPLVEREIVHVGRVMRASILACTPNLALTGYWRRRVEDLLSHEGLAVLQMQTLHSLLRELDEVEAEHETIRMSRLRNARALSQLMAAHH